MICLMHFETPRMLKTLENIYFVMFDDKNYIAFYANKKHAQNHFVLKHECKVWT